MYAKNYIINSYILSTSNNRWYGKYKKKKVGDASPSLDLQSSQGEKSNPNATISSRANLCGPKEETFGENLKEEGKV